jgi:endo-1,4-beta-xylanase
MFNVALMVPMRYAQNVSPSLKEVFKNDFLIGAALNRRQFLEEDAGSVSIIKQQFNSITPENQLKWEYVHPRSDTYDFSGSDRYVAFGEKYQMFIVGHTLVWHNQTPQWVFTHGNGHLVDRETLLRRMREHISTVVGRYKGRVKGWDVVNEAVNDDGTMRQSQWMKIIGDDYIAKAFEFAHEADPQAELYYNDYDLEDEPKRNGAIKLVKKLKAQGIRIAGIGLQCHNKMDKPTLKDEEATIAAFAKLGLKVNITELDIDVLPSAAAHHGADITKNIELQTKLNPYAAGLPDPTLQAQAQRYADLFAVFLKYRNVIDRVTFWGVTDASSWLNDWPVRGRTNYPLLFDRQGNPKPAFAAVIEVANRKR